MNNDGPRTLYQESFFFSLRKKKHLFLGLTGITCERMKNIPCVQAAKNLMNAVVLTVKASYVASTKYKRKQTAGGSDGVPLVVWKMRAPDKKPLVRREAPEETKVGQVFLSF